MRSLVWATDIDTLPLEASVTPREGFLAVRSPSNPGHWWGNMLIFEDPPAPGDAGRWEALFEAEFAREPRIRHRTFAWDRTGGELGAAHEEFTARGYDLERLVGLLATPAQLPHHPRSNRDVVVERLDPAEGADEELWSALLELSLADDDNPIPEQEKRAFLRARQSEARALFRARGGGWYVALDRPGGELLAGCGLFTRATRASVQDVATAEPHRRRGICSRLLIDAIADLAARSPIEHVVIAADPDYHALGLYESLGFRELEHVAGVCRRPPSPSS